MRIRNISPLGDLTLPEIAGQRIGLTVPAGGTLDVPDDVGAALLEQTTNWAPTTGPDDSEE